MLMVALVCLRLIGYEMCCKILMLTSVAVYQKTKSVKIIWKIEHYLQTPEDGCLFSFLSVTLRRLCLVTLTRTNFWASRVLFRLTSCELGGPLRVAWSASPAEVGGYGSEEQRSPHLRWCGKHSLALSEEQAEFTGNHRDCSQHPKRRVAGQNRAGILAQVCD